MREKTLDLTVDEWMGMYHIAADRADKAEAEVERLTDLLDHYNAKCAICDCSDDVTVLQAENAKLRKVVDAAREDLAIVCTSGETCAVCQNVENRGDNFPCRVSDGWCCGDKWVWRGEQALAELDKEERHEAGGE